MYDDLVPLTGKCSVCGAESTSRCAGCFAVFYCGADCQKRDWRANDHKARCAKPYRVERTHELGREVVHTTAQCNSSLRKRTCVISSFRISGCREHDRITQPPIDLHLRQ